MAIKKNKLSTEQEQQIIASLRDRFLQNMTRHPKLNWPDVQTQLEANPEKLWSLFEMERTGGEPDVVGARTKEGQLKFYDCADESPKGRRSACYDRAALEARKKYPPKTSAVDMANEIGIELLTEEQYFELQDLGSFDMKTSSWIHTPDHVRRLGGALFGDFRYGRVFIFHNGADSYYAARGFRGVLYV